MKVCKVHCESYTALSIVEYVLKRRNMKWLSRNEGFSSIDVMIKEMKPPVTVIIRFAYGYAHSGTGHSGQAIPTITLLDLYHLSGGKKEMKKSDLKTGYLVVTRDGHEYVVYLNVLTDYQHDKKPEDIIVCNQGDSRRWEGLDVYNEDLTYKGKENRNDIMEIHLLYHPFALQDMSYCKQMRKLLWKREETKELTVKQIEEILGYSIKIIKE